MNLDTIIVFAIIIASLVIIAYDNKAKNKSLDTISKGEEITPEDFMKLLKKDFWRSEKRVRYKKQDCPGVYVFFNQTNGKYLIGQSAAAMSMVNQHLTGHGNTTLCVDWQCGDKVTIRIINLAGSGFVSLDDLQAEIERPYIDGGYENYESIPDESIPAEPTSDETASDET